ncbi:MULTISPECIES: P-type DNA transfer ATPase VirB11 [Agrobacterium]|uniref:P-type DNA transfer ATPase VirB11 n=1 Tax=Agrobacterium TaxID=357 RepID=UPI0009B9C84A|nr:MULTISPECIES: P-type DNA transfer ATPase VirB11 [Agrobacterium]QCL77449.1 P-type DNA transfer ATPase VirB11 [Agrobacterium tumefaciens]CUX72298.1 Type IV secretion protein AvhB11 [Agrobacterium sp. NCPPB 925]
MNAPASNATAHDPHYFLTRSLEPIRRFLDDPKVVEIAINKPGHVYVERFGSDHMEHHIIEELTAGEIENIGERVAAATKQFLNAANPILSGALPTGERIQVVLPPAAADGGSITIRKQVIQNFSLEDYRDNGSLDKVAVAVGGLSDVDRELIGYLRNGEIYEFIHTAITKRVSILISGGTSSGKTTFLNACLNSVDLNERIITLEDTRELFPPQKNVVHLLASKGGQGTANVTLQNLLESSLRMRPDRLFVGEIRGAEAFPFLQAINTGHPGSMSTLHSDSPNGAYERLVMMMVQGGMSSGLSREDLLSYIKMVIPIVIQVSRNGGKRGISEILFTRDET